MSEKPSCQTYQTWMEDAFSGELEKGLQPHLEAHLQSCETCRAIWADYQALRRGMEILAETEGPSLKVQNQILRAAEAKAERRAAKRAGLWGWLLQPATVAFATLLLIAGIGYLGRQELQKQETSKPMAPAVAPQDTLGVQPEAARPAAPPPPPAARQEAPSPELAKPKAAPPKPITEAPKSDLQPGRAEEASFRMKDEAPAATTGAPEGAPAPAAPAKSLAKPAPAEAARQNLERDSGASQVPTIPEAQGGLGGATQLSNGNPPKEADKEKKREKSAGPASIETEAPLTAPQPPQFETAIGRAQEKLPTERFLTLINAAKAKIRQQNYSGALEDLLAAQRIQDTKEIQDLILLCRSHLRGDG